ncbi:MAG: tetratricopeptide repeat protein [Verrucomicrobia bacterium]|nr:tetratricopeptide repeat protein [Verrucomicrobiota bacterium]
MSTAHPTPPSAQTRAARRWLGFRLAAVAVGLLPFVLLEVGLRVFDLGKPERQSDPLAGFSQQMPLFEKVGDKWQTIHAREPYFNPQEFAAAKPTNGFRVFCLGGSTIYGHPYLSDTAMPKWLELELRGTHPGRAIEVVNCGGVSYASYRLAMIVREALTHEADAIVVATGENEFLEDRTYRAIKARTGARRWIEDRLYSLRIVTGGLKLFHRDPSAASDSGATPLSSEVKPRLDDERTGYASYHRDDEWHRQVVAQFEEAVRQMIADCRAAKVPIILVTLGSNLRDCPPYKSEHKPGLTPEDEARWQSAFDAATQAGPKDLKAAAELYRQAAAIDGEHALLDFRFARCLDQLGRPDEARALYVQAKDQDVCPLRMLEEVYRLHLAIAAETHTPLADIRKTLESLSPDGIPGNNLYLDHVHPTIGGDQRMAQLVAEKMREAGVVPGGTRWTDDARRAAYRAHFAQLDANYFSNGRRRVEWLENWARRQRLAAETEPKDARGFLHQGFRVLDLGEEDRAWESFQAALKQNAGLTAELVAHATELRDQGRPEAAQRLLVRLANSISVAQLPAEFKNVSRAVEADLAPTPK